MSYSYQGFDDSLSFSSPGRSTPGTQSTRGGKGTYKSRYGTSNPLDHHGFDNGMLDDDTNSIKYVRLNKRNWRQQIDEIKKQAESINSSTDARVDDMVASLSDIESQSRYETARIEDEIEREFAKHKRLNTTTQHDIDHLQEKRKNNEDTIEKTKQMAGVYANGLFVTKRDELKARAAATRIKHAFARKCGINLKDRSRLDLHAMDALTGSLQSVYTLSL